MPQGKKTAFKYDAAGRLIETLKGDNRTSFEYDAAGRPYKTISWDGPENGSAKIQVFDFKDQVVEERIEDSQGNWISKISSIYDKEGQLIDAIAHTDKGEAITRTYYNSRHQPIKIVDAAGKTTHMHYRYDYRNAFGQLVGYTEVVDAEGNISITIQDAMGRMQTTQMKNSLGELLQQQEVFYDGNSNKVCEIETLIKKGAQRSSVTTEYTYDTMNRLISKHEAMGRTNQKISYIDYTRSGQKKTVTTSSGICLKHTYDLRGRLSAYRASDESFSYTHDASSNLLSVKNSVDRSETILKYDGNDRLIEETLANGLKVKYRYNALNNPVEIELPDCTRIGYRYRGNQLVEVQRLSPAAEVVYKHSYDSFDLAGKITAMTLIGNGGKASFTYDTLGRMSMASYGLWEEKLKYGPTGDVTLKTIRDPLCRSGSKHTKTIHVRNGLLGYPKELRDRISVVAIAPGGYIYPGSCANAIHYRAHADRDIIPRFDLAGYRRSAHTVVTLDSHPAASWIDHAFMSPTYSKAIQKEILTFIKGE